MKGRHLQLDLWNTMGVALGHLVMITHRAALQFIKLDGGRYLSTQLRQVRHIRINRMDKQVGKVQQVFNSDTQGKAGVTFDNSFFNNCFDLVRQLKNRSSVSTDK